MQLAITFGLVFLAVFVEPVKEKLCGVQPGDCDACKLTDYREESVPEEYRMGNTTEANSCDLGRHEDGGCNLHRGGGCVQPTASLNAALISSTIFSFVFLLPVVCCRKVAQRVPINYLCLLGFTICMGVSVSVFCLFFNSVSVGLAAAMTALVTVGLTLFAVFTNVDFTGMGGYLYAALLSLIMFGLITSCFSAFFHVPVMQSVYAGAGCLIFSLYIVFDTQLIVGGKHRQHQFDKDDYIVAALKYAIMVPKCCFCV